MNIYDIAKEAGVSISTVSRVTNKKKGVKKATRKKVEEIMRKYNYHPNDPGSPVKKQACTVAILMNDTQDFKNFGVAGLVERYLWEHECISIMIQLSCKEGMQQEYIDMLCNQTIHGIVLMGSAFQNNHVKKQIQRYFSNIPIVMCNGYMDLPNVYGVLSDMQHGIKDCISLFMSKGKRNIALITINKQLLGSKFCLQAYEEGMSDWGLSDSTCVINSEANIQGGYKATKKLLAQFPQVNAIMFAESVIAAGGLRAIKELNKEVPNDISVISLNNSITSELVTPSITSLDTKTTELCWVSAQVIFGCMIKNAGAKKVMLPCEIIKRETT